MHRLSLEGWLSEVLTLHPGILTVLLLEEKAGQFVVVEEASKGEHAGYAPEVVEALKSGELNPATILGDASQLNLGVPRLVAVLYVNEAVILARINAQRLLAICAEASQLNESLVAVSAVLPTIMEGLQVSSAQVNLGISAAQATEIALNYVASIVKTPEIFVDQVALNENERIWEIHGSYRTIPFARSNRFELQLDAEKGSIISFRSQPRPSLLPLLTGLIMIIGTVLFSVWLLILNR